MTPAEHLAQAEQLLANVQYSGQDWGQLDSRTRVGIVLAHALIAAAAKLGVPHGETTTGGGPGGAQPAAG